MRLPEISAWPVSQPAAARLVPMLDDSMAPTLKAGDVAFVVPADAYLCEGLYALTLASGHLAVYRCEAIPGPAGGIRITKDSRDRPGTMLTHEQFLEAMVGQVAATGAVLVPSLLNGGLS